MTDVLVSLRQGMPMLRKAERRVAEAVLDDPSLVVASTVTQLAEKCGVSPATVTRTCRAAGFDGYKQFRMAVAAAESREQTTRDLFRIDDTEVGEGDSVEQIVAKVAYQEARAIEETARTLDLEVLDSVVAAIRRADRIEIYGAAASGLTAQDLYLKLHRVGYQVQCWSDAHLALTSAAHATSQSLAIVVSHYGTTVETNELARVVKSHGGTVAVITNHPGSPLGESSDFVLATSTREAGIRTGAMSSRTAQMAIVDFLVVRLLQSDFAAVSELLKRTYDAVDGHRLGSGKSL